MRCNVLRAVALLKALFQAALAASCCLVLLAACAPGGLSPQAQCSLASDRFALAEQDNLEQAVVKAKADQSAAETKLQTARVGHDEDDPAIVLAEAGVKDAEARTADAEATEEEDIDEIASEAQESDNMCWGR